jgi:hypothetical protein
VLRFRLGDLFALWRAHCSIRLSTVVARLARASSIRYVIADTLTAQGRHD